MTVVPRPAATLVLLRERPGAAFEVLMVQRHAKDGFAGSAFVFPGGILEPQDCSEEARGLCPDPSGAGAASALRTAESPVQALGYFIAAIRETFEETGVLLARDRAGRSWRVESDPRTVADARAALREGRLTFAQWLREKALRPAVEDLTYYAHWITPLEMPLRFDARFFLALAHTDACAEPDHAEVVACRWIAPAEALAAHKARAMRMVNATLKNLELLATFSSAADARAKLAAREIVAITPKRVRDGDGWRIVNPWEPEYDAL